MNKPIVILLSDLWGLSQENWMDDYQLQLQENFQVIQYDACVLGNVDVSNYEQEKLHQQFVESGIDSAVDNLCALNSAPIHIIGFSVGATIAWKCALNGMKIESMHLVSGSRLRYEIQNPRTKHFLYFGSEDQFAPKDHWFESMNVERIIFEGEGHDFYKKETVRKDICASLKSCL